MPKSSLQQRVAGIIGNLLEHYDAALFGLLAPFIAPLFFGQTDPITALIMTYAMIPLGLLTKPLGSIFFGYVGDRFGRKQALLLSLGGMALATVALGCLPPYQEIGPWAILLLAILRMLQSFCSAGEVTGAALFVLEHTPNAKRGLVSGWYDASSVAGMLIGSAFVSMLCAQDAVLDYWRFLFWTGGLPAILGLFLRIRMEDAQEFTKSAKREKPPLFQVLYLYKRELFFILLAAGFTYTTYAMAFTLMNGYVPLVTHLKKSDVMQINTWLLLVDMCMLPFFGWLANKFGKARIMVGASILSGIGAIPLFYLLKGADLGMVITIRFYIVLCGVAFAAPYYAWAMEQIAPRYRYTVIAIAGCLGSQLIGAPSSAISLWLYQKTLWAPAPGLYLACVSLLAIYGIGQLERLRKTIPL